MTRRSAEAWVAAAFLGATATAVGFIAAYVVDASPQALGGLLGATCALLALGLVIWSHTLLPHGTYVEERSPVQPPEETQDALVDTMARGSGGTPALVRRTLVLAGLGLGAALVVPLRSLLLPSSEPPGEALRHSPWQPGARLMTRAGDLVRSEEVVPGTELTVFPEGELRADDATAVVIRLPDEDVRLLDEATAALAVGGIVAFSKLCTHAGCPVGLYEQTTRQLFCPCHQSVFDVLRGAEPTAGPAVRPLPQLPLGVDDAGYLVARGEFRGQVGPSFWRPA
ncbi:menaquinol-cytochrome c reductase iron-sulfur subunit precursor [Blastococcus sp. DSM 46786]|uniref:QcrA and Rieske domain-containing protein n=1 Tax=Blastococcus sp. DSM 46786 TaxID=1798227 RepID=UPI0008B1A937|nr:Rieske 2Fe-2S domain-containing protein [Blastococcus sp. DSM 46786]SEK69486.1 menaquinol-cytochrome c reductase iron-sulfur subunit precursor [Blastococcus sp. DSM 46786]